MFKIKLPQNKVGIIFRKLSTQSYYGLIQFTINGGIFSPHTVMNNIILWVSVHSLYMMICEWLAEVIRCLQFSTM